MVKYDKRMGQQSRCTCGSQDVTFIDQVHRIDKTVFVHGISFCYMVKDEK